MTWAPQELQKTLYNILSTSTALQTALGGTVGDTRIYDFVPDNKSYPYVTIDIGQFDERGNGSFGGWANNFSIHVWNRSSVRGNKPVQDIQAIIDGLLHGVDIPVTGWNIITLIRSSANIITDDDNVTKHGIQIFRLMLGEA